MRASAVALVTALTLPRVAHGQEPALPCDPLGDFGCVYAPGSGNTELRTVIDPAEWRALPIGPSHFDGALGLGPGTLADSAGVGLGGGTSLESIFELDGLDVTGLFYGGPADAPSVPLSMLGRMIVRRGGMGAALRAGSAGLVSLHSGGSAGGIDLYAGSILSGSSDAVSAPTLIGWDRSGGTTDAHLALVGGTSRWHARWFAGFGFHSRSGTTTRTFSRAVDDDGNGSQDVDGAGVPVFEPIETLELGTEGSSLPTLIRIELEPDHNQQVGITGFLDYARDAYFDTTSGEALALARRDSELTTDIVGRWRGAYGNTELTVSAGYHRVHGKSRSPFGERNQIPGGLVRLGDDWRQYESQTVQDACADGGAGDDYPLLVNCPVSFYYAGGVGSIKDDPASRATARAGARHYLDLYGEHLLQGGLEVNQASYVHHFEYSGGYANSFLAEDRFVELGSGPDQCDGLACTWLGVADLRTVTRSASGFLADDWSPIDSVTLSLGGRYEAQDIEGVGTVADLVPRLGAAWDPLGGGRSRVFAATGAYLGRMPLAFNDQAFSGLDAYSRTIDPDTLAVVDETTSAFQRIPVADGIGPFRVNELLGGGEIALAGELRAGVSYMRRELGRLVENADGRITNPYGRRDTDELAVEVRSNPERPLGLRAAYTYSRLRGSWQGFVNDGTREYVGGLHGAFDDPELDANSDGPLPSERKHALDVGLSYRQPIPGGNLVVGLRAVAVSGTPVSVMGSRGGIDHVFILPRGSTGHSPMATRTALRAQYASKRGFTFFVDIINVFDRQVPVWLDPTYTFDDVSAIVGGRPEDLPFLKQRSLAGDETGQPASRNPSFGQPVARFAPWSLWAGFRFGY